MSQVVSTMVLFITVTGDDCTGQDGWRYQSNINTLFISMSWPWPWVCSGHHVVILSVVLWRCPFAGHEKKCKEDIPYFLSRGTHA